MRAFFRRFLKRFFFCLGLVTCAIAFSFASYGKLGLMGAVLAGYVFGGVYCHHMAHRLWESTFLPKEKAKAKLKAGFVLRFILSFVVLFFAIKLNTEVFGACVLGYIVFYFLALASMILTNYTNPKILTKGGE